MNLRNPNTLATNPPPMNAPPLAGPAGPPAPATATMPSSPPPAPASVASPPTGSTAGQSPN
jgi:hypothetical protein